MKKLHSLLLTLLVAGIASVAEASQMTRALTLGSLATARQQRVMMPRRHFSTHDNDHTVLLKKMFVQKELALIASDKMSRCGIGANVACLVLALGLAPFDTHLGLEIIKLGMAGSAIALGGCLRSTILEKQLEALEKQIKARNNRGIW